MNEWNSVSERSAGRAQVSRKPQIKQIQASLAMALVDQGIVEGSGLATGLKVEVEEWKTKEYDWTKNGGGMGKRRKQPNTEGTEGGRQGKQNPKCAEHGMAEEDNNWSLSKVTQKE